MNIKIIAVVFSLLALMLVAFLGFTNYQKANKTPFDFGDAPDGKAAGYFSSLFKSNGARAKKTDDIWLGQSVTMENDSKQVNLDEADDGVKLSLNSCQTSKAFFFVHLKNPAKTGTAYLNLYADWNKDGKWQGADECASEWAVRNFPIDLSKQNQEVAVYVPEFTAGKNTNDLWYRGIVSLNQQMNEGATGEFESGEVEDYDNPKEEGNDKYYGSYCDPDPLKIKHGDKGEVKILPVFFSEPINKVEFSQNFGPVNDKRQVSIQNNVITYTSLAKDVDPPKRSENHDVDFKVSFGAGAVEAILGGRCVVTVEHDEITTETPAESDVHRRIPPASTETPTRPQTQPHTQEKSPGLMGY